MRTKRPDQESLSAERYHNAVVAQKELAVGAAKDRKAIAQRLQAAAGQYHGQDWRSWNWSRARARQLLRGK